MSTFGSHYRVTTYGESHCPSVGCIVDGCPPGLKLTNEDIQIQLSRRRPGQSNLTTPRDEADAVSIQSGTECGITLGTPIALRVQNKDQRPHDYGEMDLYPRPSHADWTYLLKYGVKASSGGGRSSARETIGRVAAGAIAEKYLKEAFGVEIVAFVSSVGQVELPRTTKQQRDVLGLAEPKRAADDEEEEDDELTKEYLQLLHTVKREDVDANLVRCPDEATAQRMERRILTAKGKLDSIGGTITCVIRNAPKGIGEPCFDKLEAKLAHAMMSLPATKGFEFGSGFAGTVVPGSKHNDMFVKNETGDGLRTTTNHSGGVQGGISNGEDIYFRVAFKSVATISKAQQTAQYNGTAGTLAAKGRHDPCVLPRAVPIVETMAALTIMDAYMAQAARSTAAAALPDISSIVPPAMRPPPGLDASS